MTKHLDIPYDSAFQELINDTLFEKSKLIIAYELGRRRGLLEKNGDSN